MLRLRSCVSYMCLEKPTRDENESYSASALRMQTRQIGWIQTADAIRDTIDGKQLTLDSRQ